MFHGGFGHGFQPLSLDESTRGWDVLTRNHFWLAKKRLGQQWSTAVGCGASLSVCPTLWFWGFSGVLIKAHFIGKIHENYIPKLDPKLAAPRQGLTGNAAFFVGWLIFPSFEMDRHGMKWQLGWRKPRRLLHDLGETSPTCLAQFLA